MAAVLSAGGLASVMDLMPWLEGGWGMHLLALVASYALGAAVAFRISTSRGSLCAAVAGAALLLPLSGALFVEALQTVEEVLERVADPRDAEVIREGARGEALRLLELGAGAAGAVALVLLTTRRRRLEAVLAANPLRGSSPARPPQAA